MIGSLEKISRQKGENACEHINDQEQEPHSQQDRQEKKEGTGKAFERLLFGGPEGPDKEHDEKNKRPHHRDQV